MFFRRTWDVTRSTVLALLAALLSLATPGVVEAQTYTWIGTTTGVFTDTTKWQGGVAPTLPGGTSTVLAFTVANGHTATNDLTGPFTLNQMVFSNRGSTSMTVNRTSGGAGSFVFAGTGAAITQSGNGAVTLTNSTTTGNPIDLTTDVTVGGTGLGDVTIGSRLTGSGRLIVAGGAPTLDTRVVGLTNSGTGANVNAFAGAVLDGGNLELGSNVSILGGSTSQLTTLEVTANGGSLGMTGSNTGLLSNITIASGGTLRLLGSSSLTLAPAATLSGGGNLLKHGSGTLTVQSASPFSGTVTADILPLGTTATSTTGTIVLSGANGSLPNVAEFNIRAGGELELTSNTPGNQNSNRIADAATVNLRSGLLSFTGAPSVSVNETVGLVTGAGYSTVTIATGGSTSASTPTARDVTFTAAGLERVDRGTFLLRGTQLGATQTGGAGSAAVANLVFTASPAGDLVGGGGAAGTTTISILPYAIGGPTTSAATTTTTLLTYGPTGVRPLNTTTEFATTLVSGVNDNVNYRLDLNPGSTVTLSAPTAINSLTVSDIVSAGAVAIDGTGPLTLKSGVLMVNESIATTIAVPLAFGAREAFVYTTSGDTTLSGPLTGSNGLTKSGNAALILTGDNSGLSGQLTVNAGQVVVAAANNLPGTGAIVVNGDAADSTATSGNVAIQGSGAGPLDISRDIVVNTGFVNFAATGAGSLTLSGVISGPGGVAVSGTATTAPVILAGANTYTGPTVVESGTLVIDGDANLGNGGVVRLNTSTSGRLQLAGDWTTSRHVIISSSQFDTAGFNATWNGLVTGTGTLTKVGTGRLQINSANPFSGIVTVANGGGEVRLARDGQLNTTTYNLNNDGTLVLDYTVLPAGTPGGSGPVTVDRVHDAATVSVVNGGTLQVIGNDSRTVTERIGRLSAPTTGGIEGTLEVLSSGGQLTVLRIGNLTTGNGTLLVRGTGLAQTSGTASQVFIDQFNGANVVGGQLLPNVFAENLNSPGVVEGALFDAAVGIRLSGAGDFVTGPILQNGPPTNTPTSANFRVVTTTQTVDAANTIASLRFAPGATLDASSGTLTVATGNILSEAGSGTATISGGTIIAGIASGTTNNVLAFAVNSDLTVATVLAGNAGLSKVGAGTLTLAGANTLTGNITVNVGTLAFAPGGSLGGATPNNLTIAAGATVNLNGVNQTIGNLSGTVPTGSPTSNLRLGAAVLTLGTNTSSTFAGVISETGRLVKVGTGTLTLSGANTFSGGITVNAGAVSVADVARLGTGAVTLDGGTLTYSGTTASAPLSGLTITAAGGTLNATSTSTGAGLTLPSAFAWNGPLTKSGSGRVFAGGPLTTTQQLVVSAGTFDTSGNNLTVGGVSGTGTVAVGTGTFTPNTTTFPTSVTGVGGTLALAAGSTFTPTGTAQTVSANIAGATSVNYSPTAFGTLTLGGNNTFAGGVTGNAFARFAITHPNGFGTGPVTLNNEVASTADLVGFGLGTGAAHTVSNPFALTLFGGLASRFENQSTSSTVILSGPVTGGAPSDDLTHTVFQLGGTSSATTGTTFVLSNPANTFTSIIEVDQGVLAVVNNAALGNAANAIRLATASTTTRAGLRFDTDFTGAAAFPRTVIMRDNNNVNTQGFDVTLAGPVTDSVIPPTTPGGNPTVSTGTLTKIGTGTLTLANAGNSHTGQVVVNEGTLSVTGNMAAGGTPANNVVNVNATGRLMGTGVVNRPVNLNTGGTLQGGTGSPAGTLTTESITLAGANTLRVVVGDTNVGNGTADPAAGRINLGAGTLTGTGGLTTVKLSAAPGTLDFRQEYTVTVAQFAATSNLSLTDFTIDPNPEGFIFEGTPFLLLTGTTLTITFTPAPEPGAVLGLAVATGLAGIWVRRRAARGSRVGIA